MSRAENKKPANTSPMASGNEGNANLPRGGQPTQPMAGGVPGGAETSPPGGQTAPVEGVEWSEEAKNQRATGEKSRAETGTP